MPIRFFSVTSITYVYVQFIAFFLLGINCFYSVLFIPFIYADAIMYRFNMNVSKFIRFYYLLIDLKATECIMIKIRRYIVKAFEFQIY